MRVSYVDVKIGSGSVAFDYYQRGQLDPAARMVPATAWYGSQLASVLGDSLVEHAEIVPEPGWGGVLSLLTVPQS